MKKVLIFALAAVTLVGCQGDAPTAEPAPASTSAPGESDKNAGTGADLSVNKDYQGSIGK